MRQRTFLSPTLRDIPTDADVVSHQLMLRAGLIRQSTSGVYSFLPLGFKVLQKVERIVREEMDRAGAQEMIMPSIQPAELWQQSGRWADYGPELMRFKDRHQREFALGPTHEEVITAIVKDDVRSYKELPMTLYQIQTKFRDERRPRFGVLRGREFLMKDAYSFDVDYDGLDKSYSKMYEAYKKIFARCDLNFRAVVADSGAMGGKDTHEFMVLSSVGEDTIAYSDGSDYAANTEIAEVNVSYPQSNENGKPLEKVDTPDQKTIEQVGKYLNADATQCIKAMTFNVDDEAVMVLVRGDHEVNDIKIKHALDARNVTFATEEESSEWMKADFGFLGPVGAPDHLKIVADPAVMVMKNIICGANEANKHYINANVYRDFKVDQIADVRMIQEGDPSPDGKGTIRFKEGIEVGHVFKLGTKYSEALGATVLDDQGKARPIVMGSYGIGVSRTVAAIIEEHHDENGIIWPLSVAPFHAHLVPVNVKQDDQRELSEALYSELQQAGLEVLFDDRQERPGVKFKDSDLLGLPIRITVGKKAGEGIVELKYRKSGETVEVHRKDLLSTITGYISS
ncbi:proline--tRNA ligase [Salisediminibacterium beveridgei]|uniref:Proline--tRNA ligase n=1 Tax=Salisediminibacterium beveridgei TaxID=632773 RepID=A0A1D7QVZ9_9BACI|nr:proline--tRNA ligase [Salisediminibacterium beveridgei]AOM83149.1 Prolyl-tRNA synthetase [Salisediminibacterium beveridgei]